MENTNLRVLIVEDQVFANIKNNDQNEKNVMVDFGSHVIIIEIDEN